MNREKIIEILKLKHVILCGGSESGRKALIKSVSEGFDKDKTNLFRIPPGIRSFEEFIDTARRIFPIKPILKDQTVEEMSYDQINDVLLDWVEEGERSTFIIWEEIGLLEPKNDLYGFINEFVTRKYILEDYFRSEQKLRLLSSSVDLRDYLNSARIYFGRDPNDPVTDDQIVRNSLEIINLNESS